MARIPREEMYIMPLGPVVLLTQIDRIVGSCRPAKCPWEQVIDLKRRVDWALISP